MLVVLYAVDVVLSVKWGRASTRWRNNTFAVDLEKYKLPLENKEELWQEF